MSNDNHIKAIIIHASYSTHHELNRGWETRYPENRSLFLRLTRQVLGQEPETSHDRFFPHPSQF
jgi:hypothetical protein